MKASLSAIQHPTICSDPEPRIGGRYLRGCFPWQLTCLSSFINFYATKSVGGKLTWVPESRGEGGTQGDTRQIFPRMVGKFPTPPQASLPVPSHSLTFSMALSSSDRQGRIQHLRETEALGKPQPTRSPRHTQGQHLIGSAPLSKHDVIQLGHISSSPHPLHTWTLEQGGSWTGQEVVSGRRSQILWPCLALASKMEEEDGTSWKGFSAASERSR